MGPSRAWVQGGAARQGRGVHPHRGRAARARGALVQAHRPIEAFARDNGFDVTANPQLHTAANHLTRAPKRDTGDDDAKRARWRAEAQTFSFGEAFIAELRHELSGDITPERLRELTARLEQLPERLTREESVFSYPALAAAVRNATAGLLHPDAAGTALERVLRSESLVRLSPLAKDRPAEAPHLEVEAGMAHTRLYTTRATLEMERAVQDMAERLSHAPALPWRSSGSRRPSRTYSSRATR